MRKILAAVGVVTVTALLVGGAPPAQVFSQNDQGPEPTARTAAAKAVPRPLELPNTRMLTTRLLRSSRSTAVRQLSASNRVTAFFENPQYRWFRALRHEKCWEVPWQRTCTIARAAYRLHLTLALAARRKLWRELPKPDDWVTAVRVIQRVFPGTESWLLSCSAAEGGHGRWVRYGGGSYYPGYEYTNEVGNWLQYRWGTFKGHYRHGLDSLRERGFVIDMPASNDVRAWLSPMGAAIAGGWARWSGNDDSHWSASWGNGC